MPTHELASRSSRPPAILSGLTGLAIGGGIASVARCVVRAFQECRETGLVGREDRLLLLDRPTSTSSNPTGDDQRLARGSQARFAIELWRLLHLRPYDLVFFDQLGLARSLLLPTFRSKARRVAIFVHGIELDRAHTGSRRRALSAAWRLVANSEFTADRVRSEFPELRDRVRLATLCIDPERVRLWQGLGEPAPGSRRPAVVIVGRMWAEEPGKGHDELIDAWPAVTARVATAELWVVGEGDDRPRLEEKARMLGLGGSVRFLGKVSDEELHRLYSEASVFAMPSRQEGFGLVYAEAMWHGLPCIGSTADAAGSVIRDGETGLLVPYGDVEALARSLTRLLGDEGERMALGERAQSEAKRRFEYPRFKHDLLKALDLA